ncbi:glutathione S-transferase 1-like [Diaphorina citri]|nr:glutathione S-transferase 1-like [Diaphorina citri]
MNPLKKVPVLNDNGIYISDSHAILTYLTSQYGMNSSHLYPRDLKKRAIVDSRLHFDNGVLFPSLANIIRPMVYEGQTTILEDKKKIALEALDFVEGLLKQTEWVAGDKMTVADFSLVATVTSLATLLPEVESYWKIQAWIKRCEKNMIFYEEVQRPGLESFKSLANRNAAPK